MTDPIKFDPRIHVIVPREPTRGFKSMTDEGAMVLKCHEDTPVMDNRTKIATAVWNAMIASAPPITIDAPLPVTKAEAVPRATADKLAEALGNLMDAVGDMPADASECYPDEWEAADQALNEYNAEKGKTE